MVHSETGIGATIDARLNVNEISQRIRLEQHKLKLQGAEVAAAIGIFPQQYSNYVRLENPKLPRTEHLAQLARLFKVTTDYLLWGVTAELTRGKPNSEKEKFGQLYDKLVEAGQEENVKFIHQFIEFALNKEN